MAHDHRTVGEFEAADVAVYDGKWNAASTVQSCIAWDSEAVNGMVHWRVNSMSFTSSIITSLYNLLVITIIVQAEYVSQR